MDELIYVYCITEEIPEIESDSGFYSINQSGLYCVAGKVSSEEYSADNFKRNLADIEWVKTKVLNHEKVIENVMKKCTVIPFKFGTIFNTDVAVKEMLEKYSWRFKETLKKLKDLSEYGIKIYCDIKLFKTEIDEKDEEISKLKEEIKSSLVGKAFLLAKKKDEIIEKLVNKRINEYAKDSFEKLDSMSIKAKICKILPKEVTEREEEMILNAAFLIDNNKVRDFKNVVENLGLKYTKRGLSFSFTGPWPAYNFCEVVNE